LAAVELKKENWLFNKRFETWFKKVDTAASSSLLPGNEAPVFAPPLGGLAADRQMTQQPSGPGGQQN